jgi:membrane-bound metal-dependent hydrolase YbcI (DUF457 family)
VNFQLAPEPNRAHIGLVFIGHFGAAFAAKRAAPRVSLGWLFAACQLPDLVWPFLVLTGIERVRIAPGDTAFTPLAFEYYPWSHSLLAVLVWAAVLGALYALWRRDRRGALVLGVLVVSHWVLDWLTHRPDLPLVPGGAGRVGFGLWRSIPATLAVETALYLLGVWLYARGTAARDRTGQVAFWALAVFLLAIHAANAFGPPPPNVQTVAFSALAIWLLVMWAAWADRHRAPTADEFELRPGASPPSGA